MLLECCEKVLACKWQPGIVDVDLPPRVDCSEETADTMVVVQRKGDVAHETKVL